MVPDKMSESLITLIKRISQMLFRRYDRFYIIRVIRIIHFIRDSDNEWR